MQWPHTAARVTTSGEPMKDSQLKALIKKNTAKAAKPKKPTSPSFDSTLDATRKGVEPVQGTEAEEIFKEMKRREF